MSNIPNPIVPPSFPNIEPPPHASHFNYVMAVVCGLGGMYGSYRRRSTVSLLSGIAFAAPFGYSARLIHENRELEKAYGVATIASGVLLAVMGFRYYESKRLFPAGVVGLLALGNLTNNSGYYQIYANKRKIDNKEKDKLFEVKGEKK